MLFETIPDHKEWRLPWIEGLARPSGLSETAVVVTSAKALQPQAACDVYERLAVESVSSVMAVADAVEDSGCSLLEKDKSGKEKVARGSKPPLPLSAFVRQCNSGSQLAAASPSPDVVELEGGALQASDSGEGDKAHFAPVIRSGGWTDVGARQYMEDTHVRIDNLKARFGSNFTCETAGSFYGVFDGHGGKDAANFVKDHLLSFILDDKDFPSAVAEAVRHAYLRTDLAFAEAFLLDQELTSGTTALTVLIMGRQLLVANAGDCRAVLCKRGKAVELSRDHKAACSQERARIESLGGYVDDGYLNGQLSVARALGDWHLTGLKLYGASSPLTAEPETRQTVLTEEDEFLIVGCDGLWDVFTSQNAVDFARKKLQQHNDPEMCSKELVMEALRRDTHDNLTVVTVCFRRDPPPRLGAVYKPVKRSISTGTLHRLQDLLDGCVNQRIPEEHC